MRYQVTRRMIGDKHYEPGDFREMEEHEAAPFVRSGALIRVTERPAIETKPDLKRETKRKDGEGK